MAVEIEHLKESHFGRTVATLKKHPREVMSRCHGSPFKSPGQNIKAAFVSGVVVVVVVVVVVIAHGIDSLTHHRFLC